LLFGGSPERSGLFLFNVVYRAGFKPLFFGRGGDKSYGRSDGHRGLL
jgi:hypothetical protein